MWVALIVMIVASALTYALRPHVKAPGPDKLSDVNIPTIESGKAVPVVFGDVWIDSWMVLWYGDLGNTAIKQKTKGK